MTDDETPRIAPVERTAATPQQAELLDGLGSMSGLNLFSTLAHHPRLLKSWLGFGGRLLFGGVLPQRDREIVILRSAARSGSDYEWGQHVGIGRTAGLSDDEILACADERPSEGLDEWSRLLVQATDELVDDHRLAPATWNGLAERYDDAAMLEFTLLVGHYVMLAGMLNSVGVATEGPLPRIGSVA